VEHLANMSDATWKDIEGQVRFFSNRNYYNTTAFFTEFTDASMPSQTILA